MMLKYELKKVWTKRINRMLLIVVLLLSIVFSGFAIGSFRFVDNNGNTHTGLSAPRAMVEDKNQWKGELSSDRIAEIIRKTQNGDLQSTMDFIYPLSKMLIGEFSDMDNYEAILSADHAQISSFYDIYSSNLNRMIDEYGDTTEKKIFLTGQYGKIETPFYYEAYDSWDTMLLYAATFSLVLIVIVGFLAAEIFAEEFQCKAAPVFFSTQYGRSKAVYTKICTGLIVATLVYGGSMGLLSLIGFGVMGTSGFSTVYQLEQPYSLYPVSFGRMYSIVVICGYIACLVSASVSMLIAAKTRKVSVAVCVPFALFCLSPFVGQVLPFQTLFTLTPDQLTNIVNCARIPYIYQIGTIVFRQIPFLIGFYSLVSVLLLPIAYKSYHKLRL